MTGKKVYFAQVNVTYSDYIAYLPYAAACIAAYAWNDKEIKDYYELSDILYMRLKTEESLEKIKDPYVVAFSCYIWNMEYNLKLAEKVKEKYPDCLIVFGGHNVPDDVSLLQKYSFIDVLMHAEGEEPFTRLLKALKNGEELCVVPDISYRKDKKPFTTEKKRIYSMNC